MLVSLSLETEYVLAVRFVPQTVLALRGSYGLAKEGAMVCLWILGGAQTL